MGYYESIAGLGATPNAVTINGFLTPNYGATFPGVNVTDYFWRSMENMSFNPVTDTARNPREHSTVGRFAGCALAACADQWRTRMTGSYCGFASGGFIADSQMSGRINPCSQQQ